jgi:hypothetical protein
MEMSRPLVLLLLVICSCGSTLQDSRATVESRRGGGVLVLRLRGGLAAEHSSLPCASHAASPLALTRKMEAVWRCADTLRRRRLQRAQTAAAEGRTTTALDPGEAERTFDELRLHLRDASALLRHEVCYAMGQTGLSQAGPILIRVLQNTRSAAAPAHSTPLTLCSAVKWVKCAFHPFDAGPARAGSYAPPRCPVPGRGAQAGSVPAGSQHQILTGGS